MGNMKQRYFCISPGGTGLDRKHKWLIFKRLVGLEPAPLTLLSSGLNTRLDQLSYTQCLKIAEYHYYDNSA